MNDVIQGKRIVLRFGLCEMDNDSVVVQLNLLYCSIVEVRLEVRFVIVWVFQRSLIYA